MKIHSYTDESNNRIYLEFLSRVYFYSIAVNGHFTNEAIRKYKFGDYL